ncbi:MAG: hypothetical protein QOI42_1369 [Frankiaceae bacterium]|nr:hypothetical protein [Frankiaceae bacterium]
MTTGNVIALVFAVLFAILVALVAIPLVKLGKLLDEAGRVVHNVGDSTLPLIGEVTTSVQHVNTSLESVETVTDHAKTIAGNASTLSGLFAATLGGPLVKVAAFSYGVRRAVGDRRSADIAKRVKDEMKAERKARRGKGA